MSYRSTGRFLCDGCKIIESSEIELSDSEFGPLTAPGWLRVATMLQRGDAIEHGARHYCTACTPLILSYLAGRKVEGEHA